MKTADQKKDAALKLYAEGFTQQEIADALGVALSMVNKWCTILAHERRRARKTETDSEIRQGKAKAGYRVQKGRVLPKPQLESVLCIMCDKSFYRKKWSGVETCSKGCRAELKRAIAMNTERL